jgi:O-methyltransferase involved in polyketide biosynthesis
MKDRHIEFGLGAIEATVFLPLLGRARDAEKSNSLLSDSYAKDIVDSLDFDFSSLEQDEHAEGEQLSWAIRAWNFDNAIRRFLEEKGDAVVFNIGAGLDTTFQRVDNGSVRWVNIDLPGVVEMRKTLIPDSEREITIAKSVFDYSWFEDVKEFSAGRRVLLMAAGVLFFFGAGEMRGLFRRLAEEFPSAQFVFDAMSSPIWIALTNWQMHRTGRMDPAARLKWHLRKASQLKRWVPSVRVIDEYFMFSRITLPSDLNRKIARDIRIADFLRIYRMVHVAL